MSSGADSGEAETEGLRPTREFIPLDISGEDAHADLEPTAYRKFVNKHFGPKTRCGTIHGLTCCVIWWFLLIGFSIAGVVLAVIRDSHSDKGVQCGECRYKILESLPADLGLLHGQMSDSTHSGMKHLIDTAVNSLYFLEFYFDLENTAVSGAHGEYGNEIFAAIVKAKKDRGVDVQVIYDKPSDIPSVDTAAFKAAGIGVRTFDFKYMFGHGILHTKMVVADGKSFYIGSCNMDWKSFSQVKELGILVEDCECLGEDVQKIFEVYSYVLEETEPEIKAPIDERKDTEIYVDNPAFVTFLECSAGACDPGKKPLTSSGTTFVSASPHSMNTKHRTDDIDAILRVIKDAKSFAYGSVMDFLPAMFYDTPHVYWDDLTVGFKEAIVNRNVHVRLLVSRWNHTHPLQRPFLRSLESFGELCRNSSFLCNGSIEIKEMEFPDAPGIPVYNFTRVNHPKFVVTDAGSYISTNNWSMDYFYYTGGMSFVSTHSTIRDSLKSIFLRDWTSKYAKAVPA